MKHVKAVTNTKNSKFAMALEDILFNEHASGTRFDVEDLKAYIAVYAPQFDLDGRAYSTPIDIMVGAGALLPIFVEGRLGPIGYRLQAQPKPSRATITMSVEEIHEQLFELTDELVRRAS